MSIDVDGLLRIHAGHSVAFTDEDGFLLNGVAPVLANAGQLSLAVETEGDPVVLAIATSDDAVIWNRTGGRITLNMAAGIDFAAEAFAFSGVNESLRNDGVVRVESASDSRAIQALGAGFDFENASLFEVTGNGFAAAGLIRDDAQIINSGVISIQAGQASGFTVIGGGDGTVGAGRLVNTGRIVIAGNDQAMGVDFRDANGGFSLENSGRLIVSTSGLDSRSVGIQLPSFAGGPSVIDNSGVIRADVAMRDGLMGQSSVANIVHNSGKIFGEIDLGGVGDLVINTGVVIGDVDMMYGDDTFRGAHGRVDGAVYGGFGADSLYGGSGNDQLFGDHAEEDAGDGADLLKGGRGSDSLHGGGGADVLWGGSGADQLSGGSGADLFVYSKLSDSLVAHADVITDLATGDVIDLSGVDADGTQAGDQAFVLVSHFSGHAGELMLSFDGGAGVTLLQADVNGDGQADFQVALAGDQTGFTGIVL